MNKPRCEICGVDFKEQRCYKAHLNSLRHKNIVDNKIGNNNKCPCGKSYIHRQSLYNHQKTCHYKQEHSIDVQCLTKENNEMREIINRKDQEMRDMFNKKDKEIDELRKKVEFLFEQTSGNTTNNSHIKNQTNIENQYIVVNSFGHESIDHLTDQIICKIIKTAPFTSVPQLIEKIHFDPDHPENHNIKITNKKLNYAEIVRDNKWVTANKKKVIDDVIQKSYELLDEKMKAFYNME